MCKFCVLVLLIFCKLIKKTIYSLLPDYTLLCINNPYSHHNVIHWFMYFKAFTWAGALTSRSTVKHAELRTIFTTRALYDAKIEKN